MHRLQAKYELIHKTLAQDGSQLPTSPKLASLSAVATTPNPLGGKPRRRRIGRTPLIGQPKLFGGSLEEYLEATNEEIPLVMKSCIRVINLYGLHHQGIYRVSGSQVEINNFRESFERGEDPLADVTDASDINSVAGVFKLYLRELREPLFPILFFDQFMELARKSIYKNQSYLFRSDCSCDIFTTELPSKEDFKTRMREVVQTLPRPVFVVMRYLFSFLNQ
jgi:SLIT-ROBO Rho GTPase activating protein